MCNIRNELISFTFSVLEELRSMQEKIRLLEARISHQKSNDPSSSSPSIGPDLQIAPSCSGLKGNAVPAGESKRSRRGASTSDKLLNPSMSSAATTSVQVSPSKGCFESARRSVSVV